MDWPDDRQLLREFDHDIHNAAKKLCIPVAHIEAGLRSRDWTMPEEINRVVTDAISDLLFTPSLDADENLLREGVAP